MGSNPDDEENSSTLKRMKGAGETGYASCLGMTDNFFLIKLQKDKTRSLQYFCKLRYLFPEVMSFMNKKTEDQSMSLQVGNT